MGKSPSFMQVCVISDQDFGRVLRGLTQTERDSFEFLIYGAFYVTTHPPTPLPFLLYEEGELDFRKRAIFRGWGVEPVIGVCVCV